MPETRRGVFVTGTDTNVGKTVVAAALMTRLRLSGPVRYWKPVQTGIEQDDDTATVRALAACTPREIFPAGVRLERPVSPHVAARACGQSIDLDDLLTLASAQPAGEYWVVEGAGGVLVPLNDQRLVIDLIATLRLPAVIAARSGLGTINHTLLTLEVLRARDVSVAGVVMVGPPHPDNRWSIERYGQTRVIGELPRLEPLTPDALRDAALGWALDGLDVARPGS